MAEFDKAIRPGGAGTIKATVSTTNFKGPITKSVTVTTNDPDQPKVSLLMKATVTVPLDVQPGENIAFNGRAGALVSQQVTVTAMDGSAFDVTSVTSADPKFTTRVERLGDGGYRITVTPSRSIPVGRVSSSITVSTTHPKMPELTIRLFGTVSGDVEVEPQRIVLVAGASVASEAKVQHVRIKTLSSEPFKILSVGSDSADVATFLRTVTEGREYDLEVKYTGQPRTMTSTAQINVRTNDPDQPSLEIAVLIRSDPGVQR